MVFKGLTQRAQRILTVHSQEEARRVQADQLLPEHIIIAILKDGGGTACKTLDSLKVDMSDFLNELERDLPRKNSSFVFGDIPPSRRARTMLESAAEEARNFGHEYVGTDHLLVAAAREEDSLVQRHLSRRTVTVEMLRIVMQTSPSHFPDDIPPLSRPSARRDEEPSRGGDSISGGDRSTKPKTPPATPLLDDFSRDLTAMAAQKGLDPVIGREKEIGRAVRILARRTKNNPVLVGEPGVGKTAVVEGLAQLMVSEGNEIPGRIRRPGKENH